MFRFHSIMNKVVNSDGELKCDLEMSLKGLRCCVSPIMSSIELRSKHEASLVRKNSMNSLFPILTYPSVILSITELFI